MAECQGDLKRDQIEQLSTYFDSYQDSIQHQQHGYIYCVFYYKEERCLHVLKYKGLLQDTNRWITHSLRVSNLHNIINNKSCLNGYKWRK
jgi:hypothetical protein